MGWNVYDEQVSLTRSTSKYQGHGEKEVLADIFLQHAARLSALDLLDFCLEVLIAYPRFLYF